MVEAAGPAHNLPSLPTSFIGRSGELAELLPRLGHSRLGPRPGPGGGGKPRWALDPAGRLRADYPGGVWWCDLAGVPDPLLVPAAVGATLQVQHSPDQPMTKAVAGAPGRGAALRLFGNSGHRPPGWAVLF